MAFAGLKKQINKANQVSNSMVKIRVEQKKKIMIFLNAAESSESNVLSANRIRKHFSWNKNKCNNFSNYIRCINDAFYTFSCCVCAQRMKCSEKNVFERKI